MAVDYGVIHHGHIGAQRFLSGQKIALRAGDCIAVMRQVFRGDRPALEDFLPPRIVVLRRLQRHFFCGDLGAVVIRGAVQAANLANGIRQTGLRLLQRNFGIAGVEQHQRLSLLHEVAFIHRHLSDRTANLRGERHLVTIDIGIVGRFIVAGVQQIPRHPASGGEKQNNQ